MLDAHGSALRDELVDVYKTPWPNGPIRVDVSCFAGPVGAYTVEDPVHVTISSCDPGYAGPAALEMIFHEASHALVGVVEQKIEEAAARLGRPVPQNLWHAVIFYTAGELVRRRLGPDYVPYAARNELWGGPMGEAAPLQREWQPYLERLRSLDRPSQRSSKQLLASDHDLDGRAKARRRHPGAAGLPMLRPDSRVVKRPDWYQLITPSAPGMLLNEVLWETTFAAGRRASEGHSKCSTSSPSGTDAHGWRRAS